MARTSTLLEQIEHDALDGSCTVADALRKCVALGGRAGSEELRRWASQELRGYGDKDVLPQYRKIAAPIVIDGVFGNTYVTNQQISAHDLPSVVQEAGVGEVIDLRQGVGELEQFVVDARKKGQSVRLGLPGSAELAKLMTYEMGNRYQAIQRVYWNVSPSAIYGVIDQVRTTLVELVAQIRADTGSVEDPTAEVVSNAIHVAVHGKKSRVTLNAAQAAGQGSADVSGSQDKDSPPWWRTTKAIWAFVVGLAGIAAAVFAYLEFMH